MPFKIEPNEIVNTLLLLLSPILITIVGAYVRRIMKRIDTIEEIEKKQLELHLKIGSLDSIKAEWGEVKIQITRLIVQMENLKDQKEDQTIIKRDLQTAFKQIDKLKDSMFDIQNRIQTDFDQ